MVGHLIMFEPSFVLSEENVVDLLTVPHMMSTIPM
jgi:hypothetical protein